LENVTPDPTSCKGSFFINVEVIDILVTNVSLNRVGPGRFLHSIAADGETMHHSPENDIYDNE
jgi:hypothetical protein